MENKTKKLSKIDIIILILAIIGGLAIIFGILQATVFGNISEKKKAELEAQATVPFGHYSFAEAHFNPLVEDLSILNGAMGDVTYIIEDGLFAIYTNQEKYEIKSPKYEKRVMKDESETQTDGLRIYYMGGSIMPSEDTVIGIEYTIYDMDGNSEFRIYTFDDEIWLASYKANDGAEDTLYYVYRLEKKSKEEEITNAEKLTDIGSSENNNGGSGLEDLGPIDDTAATTEN